VIEIQNLGPDLSDFLPILQDFICPQCRTAGRKKRREGREIYMQCPACGYRWSYTETIVHLDIMTRLLCYDMPWGGVLQNVEEIYHQVMV
jgi:hypothetical protein